MLITYHGHSEFLLESAAGFSVLTDPYNAGVGYPMKKYRVDAVTVSHAHGDHNDVSKLEGEYAAVDIAGRFMLSPDVSVTAVPSFHDDAEGKKRGSNLMMKIEMDGLSIVHLGDLGMVLNEEQINALGRTEVLLIPVGGMFTIDAAAAVQVVRQLRPRIVIPMHYRTEVNPSFPVADETAFLRAMQCEDAERVPLLRVTKEDLSEQPGLVVMEHRA